MSGAQDQIDPAARLLVEALNRRGETLATCESLTAGLAAATVATVPGASSVLRGGLVTYATELKATLAGVSEEQLAAEGPVAKETARQMAAGARERLDATWALSYTGVAGPDPQDGHPVGEVWLGVAGPGGSDARLAAGEDQLLPGGRAEIRAGAVEAGLKLLLESLGE
ncbi:CinA family protein [Corynebacterium otitidis]